MFKKLSLLVVGGFFCLVLIGCSDGTQTSSQSVSKKHFPADELVGQSIRDFPDTGLVNQSGRSVDLSSLPDNPLVISFIYTRCPMASMCPLITRKMKQLQEYFESGDRTEIHLLTVTFDPDYDTPSVLREYAERRGVRPENWDFLTGSPAAITALTDRFKISTKRTETGEIVHNLRTYLLDDQHVIRNWYRGSQWSVETLQNDIKTLRTTG